jgi:hypothetical protein
VCSAIGYLSGPFFRKSGNRAFLASRFEIGAVSRFRSAILADLAMLGFAISFLTLARVDSPKSFLAFFFIEHPSWHRDRSNTVQFRTVPTIGDRHRRQSLAGAQVYIIEWF